MRSDCRNVEQADGVREGERGGGRWFALDQMPREGFSREVTFEKRHLERRESLTVISGATAPGRGNRKGQGPG